MAIARSSLLTVTSTRVRYRCSIAGEDDLDAPDLDAGANPAAEPPRPSDQRKQSHGQAAAAQRAAAGGGKLPRPSARSILGEQPSATLRESLIQQMAARSAEDETAAWAHRSLPAKKHPDKRETPKLSRSDFRRASVRYVGTRILIAGRLRPLEWTPVVWSLAGQWPIALMLIAEVSWIKSLLTIYVLIPAYVSSSDCEEAETCVSCSLRTTVPLLEPLS